MEGVEPRVNVYHERVEFVGSSKSNNISILLWNITFEDQGDYICFARNPKEKNRNHSATFTLIVVDQSMWQTHTPIYTGTQNDNFIYLKIMMVLMPLDRQRSLLFLLLVSYLTFLNSVSALFTSPPCPSFRLFLFSVKEVDNTLTVIIVSVLGGVIGLVIIVMVIKALVVHFLLKDDEKKWVNHLLW